MPYFVQGFNRVRAGSSGLFKNRATHTVLQSNELKGAQRFKEGFNFPLGIEGEGPDFTDLPYD